MLNIILNNVYKNYTDNTDRISEFDRDTFHKTIHILLFDEIIIL